MSDSSYVSLSEAIADLEKKGEVLRIPQEVDPYLQMALIQRLCYAKQGPVLLFENVLGSRFPAVSNLYGTVDRIRFLFRNSHESVRTLIQNKSQPQKILKKWKQIPQILFSLNNGLPQKVARPQDFEEITLSEIPHIHCWKMDGGSFVTLPQVVSQDCLEPGWNKSNMGMYRVQLNGNEYLKDLECGIHYQIHRGMGIHHQKALQNQKSFPVAVWIGGPPSLAFAAVMPLPEGIPEIAFAGVLGGRRVRYFEEEGCLVSADADFCILGEMVGTKPEGPFGDHIGYYSLKHDFPLLKVKKVYAKKGAIYPFTVVGRPPQEDTSFGAYIHELTENAIGSVLPGVRAVHAVDEAGVHPLLLAIGSERYLPYQKRKPMELLTQANAILGIGQTSLAKYLWICSEEDSPPDIYDVKSFFIHCLERLDLKRDLHFITKTTMDTLDYSGESLNFGSKMILTCVGDPIRTLSENVDLIQNKPSSWKKIKSIFAGVVAVEVDSFISYEQSVQDFELWQKELNVMEWAPFPLVVLCDDANFVSESLSNWLWATFTRSNPARDVYGLNSKTEYKHWSCENSMFVDIRKKPHHAPELIEDLEAFEKVKELCKQNAALNQILKLV